MTTNIAKNTALLTFAYIAQKLFSFVYFTLIARLIGAEGIGKFTFAVSFTTIMAVFIDLGITNVLIRESAKYKEKANTYLNNIISAKALFSFLTYLGLIVIINLLGKDDLTKIMVYISGFVMVLDSFTLSFWGIFRGHHNLKYESIGVIFNQVIIIALGTTGILLGWPIYVLVLALLGGSLFNLIYSYTLIRKKLNYQLKFEFNKIVLVSFFKIAVPFALAAVFTRIYGFIDQVLLSILIDDKHLGYYSVAYKITYALQFIPAAFIAAVYPAMSNYYLNSKEKLAGIFERSMFFLMIIAVPIIFGIISLADKYIYFLYTAEFAPTILALQILIISLFFGFLNFPVGSLLNACDKQAKNTLNMGITMVLNIVLNLILIPKFLHLGAAIASLITLIVLFALNLFYAPQIIKFDYKYLLIKFLKTLLAGILMMIVILSLKTQVNFVILTVLGGVVYFIAMYLFRGITISEVKELYFSIFKKKYEPQSAVTDN